MDSRLRGTAIGGDDWHPVMTGGGGGTKSKYLPTSGFDFFLHAHSEIADSVSSQCEKQGSRAKTIVWTKKES